MFSRNRDDTTRAVQPGGISPAVHSVLAVFYYKGTSPPEKTFPADGVSTYLALIFGTLLSSQGTDASFVLTLSGFPPGASHSVLRFRLYQTVSVLIPCRRGLSTFTTLADSLGNS